MKFFSSLRFAIDGIKIALNQELHFRLEGMMLIVAIALGMYLRIDISEWALIAITSGFVLTVELLNTAFEEICDKFYPEHDPHIAKIKDLAAGAVLVSALTALFVGVYVYVPHLTALWI